MTNAPDFGPSPSSVRCVTGTTNHKVQGNLRTDAPVSGSFNASNASAHLSTLGNYHTMSDISAPDFGPPSSSVRCITDTTNHMVHGNLGTDEPVLVSFIASNTSAHYIGRPMVSYRLHRPLNPNPSNSLAQERYRNNAPIRPGQSCCK